MTGIYEMTDDWVDGGTTYSAIKMTVSKTAAGAGSRLIDIRLDPNDLGAEDRFVVAEDGRLSITNCDEQLTGVGYQSASQIYAADARMTVRMDVASGYVSAAAVAGLAVASGTGASLGASASCSVNGGLFIAQRGASATDVSNTGSFFLTGTNAIARINSGSGNDITCAQVVGAYNISRADNGNATLMIAGRCSVSVGPLNNSKTIDVAEIRNVEAVTRIGRASGNTSNVISLYGVYIETVLGATGTITNRYGIYQVTAADKNYFAGFCGFGTNAAEQLLDVADDSIRIRTAKTPASASATGKQGQVAWDANYIYVCTATNTWKRAAIATW